MDVRKMRASKNVWLAQSSPSSAGFDALEAAAFGQLFLPSDAPLSV